MANVAKDLNDAGAEIIWVLEQGPRFEDGTAVECARTMDDLGATRGWCVGDDQTQPNPDVFDESAFSVARGFDMIVPRSTMQIVYSTSHGTPSGNENPSGEDVLAEVQRVIDSL